MKETTKEQVEQSRRLDKLYDLVRGTLMPLHPQNEEIYRTVLGISDWLEGSSEVLADHLGVEPIQLDVLWLQGVPSSGHQARLDSLYHLVAELLVNNPEKEENCMTVQGVVDWLDGSGSFLAEKLGVTKEELDIL